MTMDSVGYQKMPNDPHRPTNHHRFILVPAAVATLTRGRAQSQPILG